MSDLTLEKLILKEAARETRKLRPPQGDGSTGGRAYIRMAIAHANGVCHAAHWGIDGLGHAWSGGSPDVSQTDPHGPNASREMLRFFLQGPD